METRPTVRVAVDEGLQEVPGVRGLMENPPSTFSVTASKDPVLAADDADIVVVPANGEGDVLHHWRTSWEATGRPRVIIVASGRDDEYRERAIIDGAAGVLDASSSTETVHKALECVARGELWLDRLTVGKLFQRLSRGMIEKRNGVR